MSGISQLAEFLRSHHVDGHAIANDRGCMNAWADEAEQSLDAGNQAMIEVRASDSLSGSPETFTVAAEGIETEIVHEE